MTRDNERLDRDGSGVARSPRRRSRPLRFTAIAVPIMAVLIASDGHDDAAAFVDAAGARDSATTVSVPTSLPGTAPAPVTAADTAEIQGTAAARTPTDGTGARPGWVWPVPPPRAVERHFIAPSHPYGPGHRGIDVRVDDGAPVFATAAGTVSFASVVVDRPLISIDHGDGFVTSIEPVEASVAVGDRVASGQQIGTVAEGGHCGDGCAHVGVRLHGEYVNPLMLLGGLERAILLPMGG